MRGLALPVGGIVLIIISAVGLAVMSLFGTSATKTMTFSGETAMSDLHEVEMMRRTVDESANLIAQRSAYEVASRGAVWSPTWPKLDDLANQLQDQITGHLPKGITEGGTPTREVIWKPSTIVLGGVGKVLFRHCTESVINPPLTNTYGTVDITGGTVPITITSTIAIDTNGDGVLEPYEAKGLIGGMGAFAPHFQDIVIKTPEGYAMKLGKKLYSFEDNITIECTADPDVWCLYERGGDCSIAEIPGLAPGREVLTSTTGMCGTVRGDILDMNCFHVNGTLPFTLKDSDIDSVIESSVPVDQNINSTFFKLISIGRKLIDNESYYIPADRNETPIPVGSVAAGSLIAVKNSTGQVPEGCTAKLSSAGFCGVDCSLPIADMLNFSAYCGAGTLDGKASAGNVDTIADNLGAQLQADYPGLLFDITPITEQGRPLLLVNITDTSSFVPLLRTESANFITVGTSKVPVGYMMLLFKREYGVV